MLLTVLRALPSQASLLGAAPWGSALPERQASSGGNICIYIYIYICVYNHTYYVHNQIDMNIYIYIALYTYIHIYIYGIHTHVRVYMIYIYISLSPSRSLSRSLSLSLGLSVVSAVLPPSFFNWRLPYRVNLGFAHDMDLLPALCPKSCLDYSRAQIFLCGHPAPSWISL